MLVTVLFPPSCVGQMREIQLGASLDHPCTLRLLGWVRSPLQTITELCRGDLKAFYNDKLDGIQFSEATALRLLWESASGLLYLHTVGIIHRDIKPGTFFVVVARDFKLKGVRRFN